MKMFLDVGLHRTPHAISLIVDFLLHYANSFIQSSKVTALSAVIISLP